MQFPDAGTLLNQQTRPTPTAPPPGGAGALPVPPAESPPVPDGKSFELHGIHLAGNETLSTETLLPLVSGKIGQQVTLNDLNAMAARIA